MGKLIFIILFITQCLSPKISAQDIYIDKDATIKGSGSLYVSGTFTVTSVATYTNDGSIEIKGNITNDKASMPQGTGSTLLSGTAAQTLAGSESFIVNNITFNNTTVGSDDIIISKKLIIGNIATFTSGIVSTGSNSISFKSGASHASASDASHVKGTIEKIGNQIFTFPVGDGTKLRTAAISAPALATDIITCKYNYAKPTTGSLGPGLNHISKTEYWTLNRTNGASNPFVTLSYLDTYSGGVTDMATLRVANLISGTWTDMGGSGVGTLASGNVTATTASTSWVDFTLASTTADNPLPIELLSFKITHNHTKKGVDIEWITASEIDVDYFNVERSSDNTTWETILFQKATGNSITPVNYTGFDKSPLFGANYYRLKEVDFNGESTFYPSKYVYISKNESRVIIYPNPFYNTVNIDCWQDENHQMKFELFNVLGDLVFQMEEFMKAGDNLTKLNLSNIPNGCYSLKIKFDTQSDFLTYKIIKTN